MSDEQISANFGELNIKRSDLDTFKQLETIDYEPNEVMEFVVKHIAFSNFVQTNSESKLSIGDTLGFDLRLIRIYCNSNYF